MKNPLPLIVLACALPMTGCLTLSVYPLYTASDLVTDPRIEGRWTDAEAKDVWEIAQHGDGYSIVCVTDNKGETIVAHLLRLGDSRFLDLTSKDTPSLAIAGHLFAKIETAKDEFQLQVMDSSWLERKARETGLAVVNLPDKETAVAASTGELRKFVQRYSADPGAFEAATKFHHPR